MKYFAYNNTTGKTYELTKEHFDGRTLYLANRFGSYSPVSYTDILEIQAGKPSQYKVKTESGKFKIFNSEIIDQFLPKFYSESEQEKETVSEIISSPVEEVNKVESEVKEDALKIEDTIKSVEVIENKSEVQNEPKPIKTTVRKKRSASKKTSS